MKAPNGKVIVGTLEIIMGVAEIFEDADISAFDNVDFDMEGCDYKVVNRV